LLTSNRLAETHENFELTRNQLMTLRLEHSKLQQTLELTQLDLKKIETETESRALQYEKKLAQLSKEKDSESTLLVAEMQKEMAEQRKKYTAMEQEWKQSTSSAAKMQVMLREAQQLEQDHATQIAILTSKLDEADQNHRKRVIQCK